MGEIHRHPSLLQKVKISRRDKLELHLQELKKTTVEPKRSRRETTHSRQWRPLNSYKPRGRTRILSRHWDPLSPFARIMLACSRGCLFPARGWRLGLLQEKMQFAKLPWSSEQGLSEQVVRETEESELSSEQKSSGTPSIPRPLQAVQKLLASLSFPGLPVSFLHRLRRAQLLFAVKGCS